MSGPLHDERAIAAALRSWLADLAHEQLGSELARSRAGARIPRSGARRSAGSARAGAAAPRRGTISLNVCLLFLRSAGRALPAGPRAVPHAAHESLATILGAGGEPSSPTIAPGSGAAARLAERAGMDVLVSDQDPTISRSRPGRPVGRAGALGPRRVAELRPVPRSRPAAVARSSRCPSSTTRCCSSSSTRPPSCG